MSLMLPHVSRAGGQHGNKPMGHVLLDSLDGGMIVIHNAMLILSHSDITVQGGCPFKRRGFVAK